MTKWRFVGVGLAMLAVLLLGQPAQALTIWQLDAVGNKIGQYMPGVAAWVPSSDAYGAANTTVTAGGGGDYEVALATGDWGDAENALQNQAIYGAGLFLPSSALLSGAAGWQVDFTTQLYTWDSYGWGGTPGGYWDVFAVNLNNTGYYWNVLPSPTDPIVNPDPSGVLVNTNVAGTTSLPGETWAWGGVNYSGGGFEQLFIADTLNIMSTQSVYLSVTLDTVSTPDSDQLYPSYGAFNPITDVPEPSPGDPVPEPASMTLLGLGLVSVVATRVRKKRNTA